MGHALLPTAEGWQLSRRWAGPVEAADELPAGDGEDGDATDCDGAAEPGTDGGADAAAPHAATISPDNVSARNRNISLLLPLATNSGHGVKRRPADAAAVYPRLAEARC